MRKARRNGAALVARPHPARRPRQLSHPAAQAQILADADALGYAGPDPSARSLRKGPGSLCVVLGETPLRGCQGAVSEIVVSIAVQVVAVPAGMDP